MCAIGYGYGYDEIFARELGAIGKKGHLFIPSQLAAIASTFSKRLTWQMKWVSTPHA
jgi:phosphoheptose isomerase